MNFDAILIILDTFSKKSGSQNRLSKLAIFSLNLINFSKTLLCLGVASRLESVVDEGLEIIELAALLVVEPAGFAGFPVLDGRVTLDAVLAALCRYKHARPVGGIITFCWHGVLVCDVGKGFGCACRF